MAAATRLRDATSVTIMFARFIIRHIRDAARRFAGANDGNIAVIFTLAAIPVIGFVGAAIDYSRVNSARSSMQAALDSTALMLSKDISSGTVATTTSAIQQAAQAYFKALYTNPDGTPVPNAANQTVAATYTANNGNMGNTVQLTATASVTTDFLRVVSKSLSTMNFTVNSTTAWGNVKMRVALALDNTGSMADNGKITALRNAVAGNGGLIDQLSGLAKNPGDVYISVIPFAKVVNVGSSYAGATWIDWTDWQNPPTSQPANAVGNPNGQATLPSNWSSIGPGSQCPFSNSNGGFTCTSGPVNGSANCMSGSNCQGGSRNVVPSSGTYSGYICPSVDYNSHTLYNGCWNSVPNTTQQIYCTGRSSNCNTGMGNSTATCSGSGNNVSCTQTVNTGTYSHTWIPNSTSTWTGCITDRTQSFDETGDAPTSNIAATLFPANQYYENSQAYCQSNNSPALEPIMPMSYDWSTMKANINAMQPTGGTDQSVGLAWAWQSLLQTGPIPAPAEDPNATYNRVIIILSDGLNTEDRWPAYGNGSTQNTNSQGVGYIDIRQAQQCINLRNATDAAGKPMYTVYTIQVDTSSPPDPTSTLLQSCASSNGKADPSKFFMLTSSSQIATTFTTIGTALSQLRVAQ
jgi:Flp pilus assembly protein TadG